MTFEADPRFVRRLAGGSRPWLISWVLALGGLALAYYLKSWGLLSAAGGLTSLVGVLFTFRRLVRLGPLKVESDLPPNTTADGKFTLDRGIEQTQRLADTYAANTGLQVIIFGSLVAIAGSVIDALAG